MSSSGSPVLAIGFGTTVAMWSLAYVCRMSPALVPSVIVLSLVLGCLVFGGYLAGRHAERGVAAGAKVGTLSSILNLLVLGSLLTPDGRSFTIGSLAFVPGSIALGAMLGAIGGFFGSRHRSAGSLDERDWTGTLAKVAMAGTFLLVIAGGIVTGREAGLAVVDWPRSFGTNMFLYPLARMTGGIYYEHAHRLLGSLVGLTTIVLAFRILRGDARRWMGALSVFAVLLVVTQGVIGGLRVTGSLTTSVSPADMQPSTVLAVAHGVIGQIFFATMVALAVFTSRTWRIREGAVTRAGAGLDRSLAGLLVVALAVQLVLGAVLRHTGAAMMAHVTLAMLVAGLAVTVGSRAWGASPAVPRLNRLGVLLLGAVGLQVALGIGALVVTRMAGRTGASELAPGVVGHVPMADVIVTTAHQGVGALLFGLAVATLLLTARLVRREAVVPAAHGMRATA